MNRLEKLQEIRYRIKNAVESMEDAHLGHLAEELKDGIGFVEDLIDEEAREIRERRSA